MQSKTQCPKHCELKCMCVGDIPTTLYDGKCFIIPTYPYIHTLRTIYVTSSAEIVKYMYVHIHTLDRLYWWVDLVVLWPNNNLT